jgi:hypothetical protein
MVLHYVDVSTESLSRATSEHNLQLQGGWKPRFIIINRDGVTTHS